MPRLIVPASASAVLSLLIAAAAPAATLKVGPKRQFAVPSQAIQAARDGDTIEIDAGAYPGDVATIRANRLTIRGVGNGRAKLPANGRDAGGKAIWVVAGSDLTVENIEFSGARVRDRNGAGTATRPPSSSAWRRALRTSCRSSATTCASGKCR